MAFLRSVAYLLFLGTSTVFFAVPIVLFAPLLQNGIRSRIARAWARTNLGALRWLCGLDYEVHGVENLPNEAAVVLCNHQSAWETIVLRAILPLEQTWVLKRELLWIPLFGWALARFRPIAIDRASGRQAVKQLLSAGRQALEAGRWVIVFPEGTRVPPGEHRPFAIGGALLAARNKSLIVPIAHNAGVFWARRSLVKFPGKIDLVIGEPISTNGKSPTELNAEVEHWIGSRISALPLGHRDEEVR